MKVKIISSYPKQTLEVNNVFFSSDLHLDHEVVIKLGRNFNDIEEMNSHIISEINKKVDKNDLLVLLGDTMMGEKDYLEFTNSLKCENILILSGNHCNRNKLLDCQFNSEKDVFVSDYLELYINGKIICCSHYPMFNWNYQDDGSFMLHGHLHADENDIIKQIHEYKCMDVGIDNYYKIFGEYSIFAYEEICKILKNKKIINRH